MAGHARIARVHFLSCLGRQILWCQLSLHCIRLGNCNHDEQATISFSNDLPWMCRNLFFTVWTWPIRCHLVYFAKVWTKGYLSKRTKVRGGRVNLEIQVPCDDKLGCLGGNFSSNLGDLRAMRNVKVRFWLLESVALDQDCYVISNSCLWYIFFFRYFIAFVRFS